MYINPIKGCILRAWGLSLVLVAAGFSGSTSAQSEQLDLTTIYIVRHAEKCKQSDMCDLSGGTPISQTGKVRAKALLHVLSAANLNAIFVSRKLRTLQTAEPIVSTTGIDPQKISGTKPQRTVDAIVANHVGENILVVGHSNRIDDIAKGLGAAGVPELAEHQYDRLFIVHRVGSKAHLEELRYGAETP